MNSDQRKQAAHAKKARARADYKRKRNLARNAPGAVTSEVPKKLTKRDRAARASVERARGYRTRF